MHPTAGERYYLRMLLLTAKGAISFQDLKYHNGVQHPTFKEACRSRGLLADDNEWYEAFDEEAAWGTALQLRSLFVTMVPFFELGNERAFFEKMWRYMADDIQYRYRRAIGDNTYRIPDQDLQDTLLEELAALFGKSGHNITEFNLPRRSASICDITIYKSANRRGAILFFRALYWSIRPAICLERWTTPCFYFYS